MDAWFGTMSAASKLPYAEPLAMLPLGALLAWTAWRTFDWGRAPVIPLVYGAAWYEYSTRDYTGWPTAANPYIDPVPNAPTWSTRCCTSPRPPEPRRESPHRGDGRSLCPRTR
ncbi:MAG TPA: hypothetical protein VFV73_34890 [Streptosporangiaceae bacterium]|nr:hypothetical protein [Streptosporangiaceae bacterium]